MGVWLICKCIFGTCVTENFPVKRLNMSSYVHIKTHGRVSAAKKYARAHQGVIYATCQVANFSLS